MHFLSAERSKKTLVSNLRARSEATPDNIPMREQRVISCLLRPSFSVQKCKSEHNVTVPHMVSMQLPVFLSQSSRIFAEHPALCVTCLDRNQCTFKPASGSQTLFVSHNNDNPSSLDDKMFFQQVQRVCSASEAFVSLFLFITRPRSLQRSLVFVKASSNPKREAIFIAACLWRTLAVVVG